LGLFRVESIAELWSYVKTHANSSCFPGLKQWEIWTLSFCFKRTIRVFVLDRDRRLVSQVFTRSDRWPTINLYRRGLVYFPLSFHNPQEWEDELQESRRRASVRSGRNVIEIPCLSESLFLAVVELLKLMGREVSPTELSQHVYGLIVSLWLSLY